MAGSFPGKFNFDHYPWLRKMHDVEGELNIGQKAAQLGYTELLLNLVFYHIDILGQDCLYILPTKTPDATDFSASRFDAALELSPHLQNLFSDVKNVGHKRAGSANLYVRGSQSKAGLRSIPINFIAFDEVDVMNQSNIPLAMERVSGQLDKTIWMVSTPTHEDLGINAYFKQSTQEHFFFKCPSCSRFIELIYPESIEICGDHLLDPRVADTFIKCYECKNKLNHHYEAKVEWLASTGDWVATNATSEINGFYVNQMYSPTIEPREIAESYFRSQINPADEQELFNSKLGLPHTAKGARLSQAEINLCRAGHRNGGPRSSSVVSMGVDVGSKVLHVEIDEWLGLKNSELDPLYNSMPRVLVQKTVPEFEDLAKLMMEYGVMHCVIDAQPEKRDALRFANKFYGSVTLCYYGHGIGRIITKPKEEINEPIITVDRTAWIDQALGRFRSGQIKIPYDTPQEYCDHLIAVIKHFEKNKDGDTVGKYITGENVPDHYAHARTYTEIAFKLIVSRDEVQNVGKVI